MPIFYDRLTRKKSVRFNGRSKDATVVDAATHDTVVAHSACGKPKPVYLTEKEKYL